MPIEKCGCWHCNTIQGCYAHERTEEMEEALKRIAELAYQGELLARAMIEVVPEIKRIAQGALKEN